VLAAIDHLRRLGHDRPTVVVYHQPSPDSPFQTLLYRRAWEHGVAPIPLWDLADLDAIVAVLPADTRLVLHLHWVNRVLHGASGPDDIAVRLAAFGAVVDRAITAGVRVVWTVHNVLPHDTPFEAADIELRRMIVDRASMIHVLAAATPELAAEHYRIPPDKVVHVPLPSFLGAYPDIVDRAAARFALGLPADAYVLLLVGGLRPHKGFDTLLDAFDIAGRQEARLHLLVAGPPAPTEAIETFLARAAGDPRISLHARWIPSDDMQLFFRAANVAILPYLRTLNSAALMTALAFDLPVIAPPVGGIAETIEPAVSVTFEPGDVESLSAAILAAREFSPDAVRVAARRISEAHDAVALSDAFMTALVAATDAAVPTR
jgi:beta-1,4-mannosyltransferase